jgi:hypothetical protein
MVTREAIRLWKNSNEFLQSIDTQYDDQFARSGAKIGQTLRIRLPNDYTVTTGPALSVQDTVEPSVTLAVATQKHVDVSFSSQERTMSIDDYSRRVMAPMVNNLAGAVAADIMSGAENICNLTANFDGGGNVLSPNATTWLNAGAILDLNSCPRGMRKIIMDPLTQARTVGSLSGLFNPQNVIGQQYRSGTMQEALGFDWKSDQTVIKHTTSNYSGAPTVSGAGQTGNTIVTSAIPGGYNVGDIITFTGVNAVNRITKETTGQLRQFVVTAPVPNNGTSVNIYPALIPASGGNKVQYQTVDVSPNNLAPIVPATLAASVYRKNFAFAPEAVTMVTADLEMPGGIQEGARESFDGISMRMITVYIPGTDQTVTRLDVLYGYYWVRPEWAVAVPDAI